MNTIPEELAQYIYFLYFKENILPKIINKGCISNIYLSADNSKFVKCQNRCYNESIYCVNCKFNNVSYY